MSPLPDEAIDDSGAVQRWPDRRRLVTAVAAAGVIAGIAGLVSANAIAGPGTPTALVATVATLAFALALGPARSRRHLGRAGAIVAGTLGGLVGAGLWVEGLEALALGAAAVLPSIGLVVLGHARGRTVVRGVVGGAIAVIAARHGLYGRGAPGAWVVEVATLAVLGGMGLVASSVQRFAERAQRLVQAQREEISRLGQVDPASNLANKRSFLESLQAELARALRVRSRVEHGGRVGSEGTRTPAEERLQHLGHTALLVVGLDRLSRLSDAHGHAAVDAIIGAVGKALGGRLLREGDFAARFGDDTFVVFEPDTNLHGALQSAERIRLHVEKLQVAGEDGEVKFTVAIGVSESLLGARDVNELIGQAQQALGEARQAGGNCCVAYVPLHSLRE